MWFYSLFLSAFIALSICQDFHDEEMESLSSGAQEKCTGPDCPCSCIGAYCPPCPQIIPYICLVSCGDDLCPCEHQPTKRPKPPTLPPFITKSPIKPHPTKPTEAPSHLKRGVYTVSTIDFYPSGPICSGFHIGPRLLITSKSCVLGKKPKDLFVTIKGRFEQNSEVLDVLQIYYPEAISNHTYISPVVLLLSKPKSKVEYLQLPTSTLNEDNPCEMHKWLTSRNAETYYPAKYEPETCLPWCGRNEETYICAVTRQKLRMGWNDIGTPLVEHKNGKKFAQGIYTGVSLYENVFTHRYLPLIPYVDSLMQLNQRYSNA